MTHGHLPDEDEEPGEEPLDEEADLRRPGWLRWAALGLAVLLLIWAVLTVLGR